MIARLGPLVALAAVVAGVLVLAADSGGSDRSPATRAERVAASLACPVCEGRSVADSPSEMARNMAADIRSRIDAGESDAEIRAAYIDRYGETVLLSPPASGISVLVWVLPVVALGLAAGGLTLAFRRWRHQPRMAASDADRAIVAEALARRRTETEQG